MILGIDASRANVREKTGVEWYAWRIIQELKKIVPPEVRVILYSREPLEGTLAELPPAWESKIIKTPGSRLWTQYGLSFEMLRNRPDVLFVPAHVIPLIHPPTVMTVHDVGSERHPESYSFFQRLYHRWSTRYALRHARCVITPSRFTAQEICGIFGHPHCELQVIHLGINVSDQPQDSDVAGPPATVPRDPYVLHIGRLGYKKGTMDLIRAFEIVKEDRAHASLRLVLMGGVGHRYQEVEKAINNSSYREYIHRLGWLPEADKRRLLRSAHIFVFPSKYEGFGVPILEAAAYGVPVVARRVGSLPEIAGHDLVHWFGHAEQLSLVLKNALHDTDWHVYVKSEGPKHATRFSWRAAALRTWEVLQRSFSDQQSLYKR